MSGASNFSPTIGFDGVLAAPPGSAVTQATSKSTGVTTKTLTGTITTHNAALADVTTVTFTVTNALVKAKDLVQVMLVSGHATAGTYLVWAEASAAGSFKINVRNISGGSLGEALVISYKVVPNSIA